MALKLTDLSELGSATFTGEISQIYNPGNTGAFQYLKNPNSGNAAYTSKKWQNDDSGFGEIWRNSSTRNAGAGNTVSSFNMYNSAAINFWSGGNLSLTLDASQNAIFAGDIVASGGAIHIKANQIQSGYNADSEDSDIWINYQGYAGGTTRYRDFRVGDGKQNQLLLIDGSNKQATFAGNVNVTNAGRGDAKINLK